MRVNEEHVRERRTSFSDFSLFLSLLVTADPYLAAFLGKK